MNTLTRRHLLSTASLLPAAALLAACSTGTTPGALPPLPINITLPPEADAFLAQMIAIINDVRGSGATGTAASLVTQLEGYITQIEQNPPSLKAVVGEAAIVVGDISPYLPAPWNLAASVAAQLGKVWAGTASARYGAARPMMTSAEATYVLTHIPAEGRAFLAARGIGR